MTDTEIRETVIAIQKAMGSLADARIVVEKYRDYEESSHPEKTPMYFSLCDAYDICKQCGSDLSDAIGRLEDHLWD